MSESSLGDVAWAAYQLPQALERLAESLGTRVGACPRACLPPPPLTDGARFERWLRGHARRLGVETTPTLLAVADLAKQLRGCGPALVRLDARGRASFFAVRRSAGADGLELVGPRGEILRVPAELLATALLRDRDADRDPTAAIDALCRVIAPASSVGERERVADALGSWRDVVLRDRCWLVANDPCTAVRPDLRRRWIAAAAGLVATYAAQRALWVGAYALLGMCAAAGPNAVGWVYAWLVAVACSLPLDALMGRLFGDLALSVGAGLEHHVFARIVALDPRDARQRTAGDVLARVQESQELQGSALASGLVAVVSAVDVVLVAVLLARVGTTFQAYVFGGLVLALAAAFVSLYRRVVAWSDHRLAMTGAMVEDVLHHRTRAVQLAADRARGREDEWMTVHHRQSRRMDELRSAILGVTARLWLVLAVLSVVPTMLGEPSAPELTLLLGGIVVAHRVLDRLAHAGLDVVDVAVSMAKLRALVRSPRAHEVAGDPDLAARLPFGDPRLVPGGRALLELQEVGFRHCDTGLPVLSGCDLRIESGERILLEGRSGGGKSTLVSLVGAVRHPREGSIRLHGLDLETIGTEAWRDSVVCVPQFQLNHVFSGSLAFNLLMGRRWPPRPGDLEDASALCDELGLGPLVEHMPAGLAQPVGEAGWQLSHGERIRLFLARALLQGGDVFVLDESLSALDPETQLRVLTCIDAHARTVVLSAHT